MAVWGRWMESAAEALIDVGNPLGPPATIGGDAADPATGFSLLEAESTDAALALLENHPMANRDGMRIDVHEAFSM